MPELLCDYMGVLDNEDQPKSAKPSNVMSAMYWKRDAVLYYILPS